MLLLIIIFLPFFGSISAGLFGFYIGRRGSVCLTTFTTFLSCLFSGIIFYQSMIYQYEYLIYISDWIDSDLFSCSWCFLFDRLTMVLLIVITSVSTIVHFYSGYYMSKDPHLPRFMSFLSLFTFFMILLVTGNNFMQMFVGWEGVGFCSYLLINFWFTRLQANKAAIKAMLMNRVSDLILLLGILTIFYNLRTLDYFSTFEIIPVVEDYGFHFLNSIFSIIDVVCILILIGAMGKSAQIFLHLWLPDAMEGPTPVSALIHAATMVTAGVYLVTRCSPLYEYSPLSLQLMTIIGSSTAFFASTVALVQNDFKKIIAYSTCSQLGYMFFACGLSNYPLAIFHLSNHAYFKALLFLGSGVVIHAMDDEQDIRKMGGLRRILPYTYVMFLIGSLSLTGFPFLSGFYSKDLIIEVAGASFDGIGHFAYWLGIVGVFCTSFYSMRLVFFIFLSSINSYKNRIQRVHDASFEMGISLGLLALGSIFSGYFLKDMFVGLGSDFWNNSIFIHPFHHKNIDAEFLEPSLKLLPSLVSFFGMSSALYLYFSRLEWFYHLKISKYGLFIYNFLNRKWYFDKIYSEFINQCAIKNGYQFTYKMIDKGLIEMCGPYGFSGSLYSFSKKIISLQTGYIYHYSLLMLISILFLLNIIFFSILYSFNITIILLFFFVFILIN